MNETEKKKLNEASSPRGPGDIESDMKNDKEVCRLLEWRTTKKYVAYSNEERKKYVAYSNEERKKYVSYSNKEEVFILLEFVRCG